MGLLQSLTSTVTNTACLAAGTALGCQVGLRYSFLREPRPFPHQWAGLLEHPLRLKYREPTATLGPYGIAPGMQVMDLGCGTGLFTEAMARLVGPEGRVHAVDIQAPMLERTRVRLQEAGLTARVELHHAGAYHLPLPDDSLDLVVAIATLPQIPDRIQALNELRRVLKPDGRLILSDEMPLPSYVPAQTVRNWLRLTGFRYAGQMGTPFCYSLVYANG